MGGRDSVREGVEDRERSGILEFWKLRAETNESFCLSIWFSTTRNCCLFYFNTEYFQYNQAHFIILYGNF